MNMYTQRNVLWLHAPVSSLAPLNSLSILNKHRITCLVNTVYWNHKCQLIYITKTDGCKCNERLQSNPKNSHLWKIHSFLLNYDDSFFFKQISIENYKLPMTESQCHALQSHGTNDVHNLTLHESNLKCSFYSIQ